MAENIPYKKILVIAFEANLAFYETFKNTRNNLVGREQEFDPDEYVYFSLDTVPNEFNFYSKSKKIQNGNFRKKELKKYLCFKQPIGLNQVEVNLGRRDAILAAINVLNEYGIKSRIRYSHWG